MTGSPVAPADRAAYARLLVRTGLNLQAGQRVLLTDPYDAHGVLPESDDLVEAIRAAALDAGAAGIDVISTDPAQLETCLRDRNRQDFSRLVARGARAMERAIDRGDALLFLSAGGRRLPGLEPGAVAEFRALAWNETSPALQNLTARATNWTVAAAPTGAWAGVAFVELPPEQRLRALWDTVLAANRIAPGRDAAAAWTSHLAALAREQDELNNRRVRSVRFHGRGTDLTMHLPAKHRWCTAALTTRGGLPFVVNLPTEEIFTLPQRDSATGTVRLARPVSYGGAVIEGAELEFAKGRVVRARAERGGELLRQVLATDAGAARLGEVAIVPAVRDGRAAPWQHAARCHHHVLLDENAGHHVALGESYGFTLDSWWPFGRNRSLIHLDLPLDAEIILQS